MSREELLALPMVVSLTDAGRALSMGRDKARELHRSGEFPVDTVPMGQRTMVTKPKLLAFLGLDMDGNPIRGQVA